MPHGIDAYWFWAKRNGQSDVIEIVIEIMIEIVIEIVIEI